jgi:hypothetical protein
MISSVNIEIGIMTESKLFGCLVSKSMIQTNFSLLFRLEHPPGAVTPCSHNNGRVINIG